MNRVHELVFRIVDVLLVAKTRDLVKDIAPGREVAAGPDLARAS
jgi:hypothetical protein